MINKILLQFKYEIIICQVAMVQKTVHNGTDFEANSKEVIFFPSLFLFTTTYEIRSSDNKI